MPYHSLDELPKGVKNNLPQHAQEIYMEAFNHAYEQYKNPKKRQDDNANREETAHRVAWSAVENKYHKNQAGKWVAKEK